MASASFAEEAPRSRGRHLYFAPMKEGTNQPHVASCSHQAIRLIYLVDHSITLHFTPPQTNNRKRLTYSRRRRVL